MKKSLVIRNFSGPYEARRARFSGRGYRRGTHLTSLRGLAETTSKELRRGLAWAVVSDDKPRLLAAHSELGYTSRAAEALPGEPEAVTAEEQRRQTQEAHRRDRLRIRREWENVHQAIDPPLRRFAEVAARTDPRLHREVGNITRALRRVDRELQ
jgi:hypothetical protein